jgi:hypothetical protein
MWVGFRLSVISMPSLAFTGGASNALNGVMTESRMGDLLIRGI